MPEGEARQGLFNKVGELCRGRRFQGETPQGPGRTANHPSHQCGPRFSSRGSSSLATALYRELFQGSIYVGQAYGESVQGPTRRAPCHVIAAAACRDWASMRPSAALRPGSDDRRSNPAWAPRFLLVLRNPLRGKRAGRQRRRALPRHRGRQVSAHRDHLQCRYVKVRCHRDEICRYLCTEKIHFIAVP